MEPQAAPSLDDIKTFLNTPQAGPSLDQIKEFLNSKPQPEEGTLQRFGKGLIEGVGQAGVGMMQGAADLVSPKPIFGQPPVNSALANAVQPTKDLLTQTVNASRQRVGDLQTAGKIGEVAGNVAGAVPTLAMVPEAAEGEALNVGGKLLRGAIGGGETGAVQPLGTGESRGANVVGGATLGTALAGAGAAVKPAANGLISALDAGKRVLVGRDADQLFQDVINRSSLPPEQLLQKLQQGNISSIADVAGDDVQGLTRSVAKSGIGKNIISDALEGRSMDAVKRVSQALNSDVSDNSTYFGNLDDVAKARAQVAAPLYKMAYEANPVVSSDNIDSILQTPAGRTALKSAAAKMQNDMSAMGTRDPALEAQAKMANMSADDGVARGLNLRSLDYVKRGLDDQITTAQRAGQSDDVRILSGLKNNLLGELDSADKTGAYSMARKTFSGFSNLQDAQKAGLEFDSQTPEQLKMAFKGLTPGEQDAFRIGVRENLQRTVNQTADGADPAKRIFGNTQKRAQLQEVFGTGQKFNDFSDKLNEEINAARTKFRVLGGSRTDYNLGADSSFGDIVDKVASQGAVKGTISTLIDKAADIVKNRYLGINDENSKIVANALVNRDAGISALKKIIANGGGTPDAKAAQEAIGAIQAAPNPTSKPYRIDIGAPNPRDIIKRRP